MTQWQGYYDMVRRTIPFWNLNEHIHQWHFTTYSYHFIGKLKMQFMVYFEKIGASSLTKVDNLKKGG